MSLHSSEQTKIDSTKIENFTDTTIMGYNVTLGKVPVNNDLTLKLEQTLTTVGLGQTNPFLYHGEAVFRAPNLPSGYDQHGVATFGDGKENLVTTFLKDDSVGPSGQMVYKQPLKEVSVRFTEFST